MIFFLCSFSRRSRHSPLFTLSAPSEPLWTQDTVALLPHTFAVPGEQALISALNKKYANRVLHDVGLCICVFDLVEAGEGKVRYGDGCLWHKGRASMGTWFASDQALVVFRMVVFRPFASEVILAKVKSSSEDGIRRM